MPRNPGIPGLSPATERAIGRLERDRFQPGDTSAAYRLWRRTATGSFTSWERSVLEVNGIDFTDTDDYQCSYTQGRGRSTLAQVIRLLPAGPAAELRRQVQRLDTQMWNKARHAGATYRLTAWFDWQGIW
ncbi:hypothetical protein [Actinoplanes derwentensis]|nr:hypothetical protein [Actinoplanes derwentensis]GID82402.1 hypothetical protein Ade03nite_13260 [Actinoplanes derwentensis]